MSLLPQTQIYSKRTFYAKPQNSASFVAPAVLSIFRSGNKPEKISAY